MLVGSFMAIWKLPLVTSKNGASCKYMQPLVGEMTARGARTLSLPDHEYAGRICYTLSRGRTTTIVATYGFPRLAGMTFAMSVAGAASA
jgi:hypothetical protein